LVFSGPPYISGGSKELPLHVLIKGTRDHLFRFGPKSHFNIFHTVGCCFLPSGHSRSREFGNGRFRIHLEYCKMQNEVSIKCIDISSPRLISIDVNYHSKALREPENGIKHSNTPKILTKDTEILESQNGFVS
jgi:hypothetical protein